MDGDLRLDVGDTDECLVPARLQLPRDKAVGGIGGVILAKGTVRRIARCFEIAQKRFADLIAPVACFRLRRDGRRNRSRFDNL